jgi:hypothetical protein
MALPESADAVGAGFVSGFDAMNIPFLDILLMIPYSLTAPTMNDEWMER